MMTRPHPFIRPQPGVLDIAAYQGGEATLPGQAAPLKLSSNENPFGPSAAAVSAFREAAGTLHVYPDSAHRGLRGVIARVHGLDADRVICGAGSDEILALLAYAYAGPGDEVVHSRHGFGMYRIGALAAGATPVEVPEPERRTDVDRVLGACTSRTRLVFVANPNNPTGTFIPPAEVERLAAALPRRALLVMDGAYADYVPDFDGHAALVEARDNVVMTRTFSKIHGLGGLRIGWGYGPDHVIDALARIRPPFNLSTAGIAAATAAMEDRAHVDFCRDQNRLNRARLAEGLTRLGAACDPSEANFVLARFRDPDAALAADGALRAAGIIVRRTASFNLPEGLRITVGDATSVERVLAAVAAVMRAPV